jgi:hypothetical protein
MEREPGFQPNDEVKVIGGVTYRKVDSGYTVRQYFSHSTPEKGPGPGWDHHLRILEKYHVENPAELPDEPYYLWEEVEED